jgi:hypothetical protein
MWQKVFTLAFRKRRASFGDGFPTKLASLNRTNPEILAGLASLPCVLATLSYDGLFEKKYIERQPVIWLCPDKVADSPR